MIWQTFPKISFVSREVSEKSLHAAIINVNDGPFAVHKILQHFGFLARYYTVCSFEKWKKKREQNVKSKMSETTKLRRKKLRGLRKSFGDREKELEWGDSYDSGGFS